MFTQGRNNNGAAGVYTFGSKLLLIEMGIPQWKNGLLLSLCLMLASACVLTLLALKISCLILLSECPLRVTLKDRAGQMP